MATIDIKRPHKLGTAAAKAKLDELAKHLARERGAETQWRGDVLHFDTPSGIASGTSGTIAVTADAVTIAIDLPLRLRAFKRRVASGIDDKLDELLGKA